jgi:hypothetical protein
MLRKDKVLVWFLKLEKLVYKLDWSNT